MRCKTREKIARIMSERSELYHKATSDTIYATQVSQTDIDNKEIELLLAFAELKSYAPEVPETITCNDGRVYHLQEHIKMQYRYVLEHLYDPKNVVRNPTHRIEQILCEVFISERTNMLIEMEEEGIYIAVE